MILRRSPSFIAFLLVAATCSFGVDKPKTVEEAIPKTTVKFTLVQMPAGRITLKDQNGKDKEVFVKSLWIGQTEVTWEEYDIFWLALDLTPKELEHLHSQPSQGVRDRPKKPYEPPDRGWGHDGFPACGVPAYWAKKYCNWLSAKTGKKYRLPTEAEWEYACRAGGAPLKLDAKKLDRVAWFDLNSDDHTHHVAQKSPNEWGLFDMLGNVGEWVTRGDLNDAIAGGSFQDDAADVHSGAREAYSPKWQRNDPRDPKDTNWFSNGAHVGFRVVRED